jgi:phenylalanyl-tRNA synthetase alpha subunit
MINIQALENETLSSIQGASTLEALEAIRVDVVGKNGKLTQAMKDLAQFPPYH